MTTDPLAAVEEAVKSKRIPVQYQGSTACVRLADVYAVLAATPPATDPERLRPGRWPDCEVCRERHVREGHAAAYEAEETKP